jgi:tartrate dehydrogenase/decarboxylase/D-malate dehydrogenase
VAQRIAVIPGDGIGTIGVAPSANINPEGRFPSLFEPVRGSAPDIAGQSLAHPTGQIGSGALMLEHSGHTDAGAAMLAAIEAVIEEGATQTLTPDLKGQGSTRSLGKAIAARLAD